jgi:hypothetical protein
MENEKVDPAARDVASRDFIARCQRRNYFV